MNLDKSLIVYDRRKRKSKIQQKAFSSESSQNTEILPNLPFDVKIKIALHLQYPSNILLSGREGRSILKNPSYRSQVDLSKFFLNTRLIKTHSEFFSNCVANNNPQALCLRGIECLCNHTDLYHASSYIQRSANLGDTRAVLISSILHACVGNPIVGMFILENRIPNWRRKIVWLGMLAREIEHSTLQLIQKTSGIFNNSWSCPNPSCEFQHSTWECAECFLYQHSKLFVTLY